MHGDLGASELSGARHQPITGRRDYHPSWRSILEAYVPAMSNPTQPATVLARHSMFPTLAGPRWAGPAQYGTPADSWLRLGFLADGFQI